VAGSIEHFDAVVIGAGFSGMYMVKSLRDKLGLKVRVYEEAETVGGTGSAAHWGCSNCAGNFSKPYREPSLVLPATS
jgi:cation diffusion facilitator CzcD-associated flavoprotein CzcO